MKRKTFDIIKLKINFLLQKFEIRLMRIISVENNVKTV